MSPPPIPMVTKLRPATFGRNGTGCYRLLTIEVARVRDAAHMPQLKYHAALRLVNRIGHPFPARHLFL